MDKNPVSNPRQSKILDFITERGSASIKQLSAIYGVSQATIRRDLDDLAEADIVQRTHGGAMKKHSTTFERGHSEKMQLMIESKKQIAAFASTLIHDGESVFLDSGSTTYFVAQNIAHLKDLTVITNNLDIACSVNLHPTSAMIVTGGIRRENFSILIGNLAEEALKNLYVDICFMGCDAVDPRYGVYNSNHMELGIKKQIAKCGKKTVLVTDHTKFKNKALAKVCNIDALDMIISDNDLEPDIIELGKKYVKEFVVI